MTALVLALGAALTGLALGTVTALLTEIQENTTMTNTPTPQPARPRPARHPRTIPPTIANCAAAGCRTLTTRNLCDDCTTTPDGAA